MATTQHRHHDEHDHAHDHNHDYYDDEVLRFDWQGWTKALLLLGTGLYFAYNIISGNLTNYINIRFAWLSYLAVVLLLLMAAYAVYQLLGGAGSHAHHDHDHGHDHDHAHGTISWGGLFVIAVPLLIGTLIPSRPLGADALSVNSISLTSASAAALEQVNIPPEQRNVLDWLRAFGTSTDYAQFNGLPADLVGFVYDEPSFGDEIFMVARFTVSCCVADASGIGLPVIWSEELPLDQWVRVRGTLQVGDFRGDLVPLLRAEGIEIVDQPQHPYLYP